MSTMTHCGPVSLDVADLADAIAQLRSGADRVIYFVPETAYMVIIPRDIPAVEAFIADESDTLALPGGTLDRGWTR